MQASTHLIFAISFVMILLAGPSLGSRVPWQINAKADGQKHPVVIVPGDGGNQLDVRLTDDYKGSNFWCWRWGRSGYFRLWLSVVGLVPPFTQCFAERIKLEYNAGTKKFHNPMGIITRVPYFGSTEGMEYLDPLFRSASSYMAPLVDALRAEGYEAGKSLFGAPYDFRYAPGPNAADVGVAYAKDWKKLIETASEANDGLPVVIVSHSLGGLWTLHLLNQQTIEWKKKYVGHFISIATPWGGCVQEMLVFASGYAEGVPLVDPLILRTEQRSSESNLWMLPVPAIFNNSVLVYSTARNYTASDLKDFFNDIGYPQGWDHYITRVPGLIQNIAAPLIPATLIFGEGVKTPECLKYSNSGFDYQPEIVYGEGDGTVNLCSLASVISNWSSIQGQILTVIKSSGKRHTTILSDPDSVKTIVKEIQKDYSEIPLQTLDAQSHLLI